MQQKVADVAKVDTSAVEINLAAGSVQITAIIAVPASTTAASMQTLLLSELYSAAAASDKLGLEIEEVPIIVIASPPSPPLTSPLSSPPLPATPRDDNTGDLPKNEGGEGGTITMWTLIASGGAAAALLAVGTYLYFARKRRRVNKQSSLVSKMNAVVSSHRIDPMFDSDAVRPLAVTPPPSIPIPDSNILLGGSARLRAGSSWYRPVQLHLIAAPKHDSAPDAPAWSTFVVDGVSVAFKDVVRVRMAESELELIVEQKHRTFGNSGVLGGPPRQHLRMYSRSEFNLWRDALHPKIVNSDLNMTTQSCAHMPRGGHTGTHASVHAARLWVANEERISARADLQADLEDVDSGRVEEKELLHRV